MSADAGRADDAAADAAGTAGGRDVRETLADSPLGPEEDASPTEEAVWSALDGVPDPHLPLSLVEMAMIYDVDVDGDEATVEVTFPCMGCPAYEFIHEDVRAACRDVGVDAVEIDVVWDPVWSKDMMPAHAKESLRRSGIGI